MANIFNRRQSKLNSLITSAFTSAFVYYWPKYFNPECSNLIFRKYDEYSPSGDTEIKPIKSIENFNISLKYPPSFDGRCVLYPNEKSLLDYLKWRQVDCHINNLYNTVFYTLTGEYSRYVPNSNSTFDVYLPETEPFTRKYHSHQDATKILSGTSSGDKNEIMFSEYGVNYNNEIEQFRKGTILTLDIPQKLSTEIEYLSKEKQSKATINKLKQIQKDFEDLETSKQESFFKLLNVDIIGDAFWQTYGFLLKL